MKKLFLSLLVVMLFIPVNAIIGGGDKIYWSSDTELIWKDFKKEVPKTSKAKTHGQVGIDILNDQKDDHTMEVSIYAYFLKSGSSKPDLDGQTDDALHHEQYRFNLAEVYARMLRKQLGDSTFKTMGKYFVVASKLTKQLSKELSDEQHKYDGEIGTPTKDTAQQRWDKYIDAELLKYAENADPKLEVTFEKKITEEIK